MAANGTSSLTHVSSRHPPPLPLTFPIASLPRPSSCTIFKKYISFLYFFLYLYYFFVLLLLLYFLLLFSILSNIIIFPPLPHTFLLLFVRFFLCFASFCDYFIFPLSSNFVFRLSAFCFFTSTFPTPFSHFSLRSFTLFFHNFFPFPFSFFLISPHIFYLHVRMQGRVHLPTRYPSSIFLYDWIPTFFSSFSASFNHFTFHLLTCDFIERKKKRVISNFRKKIEKMRKIQKTWRCVHFFFCV